VEVGPPVLIEREAILAPVDGEAALADPIGEAAGDGTNVGRERVAVAIIETKDKRMVDAGKAHVANGRTNGEDRNREPAGGDRHFRNVGTIGQPAKRARSHELASPGKLYFSLLFTAK
jgi:hypothetical protein